MATFFDKQSGKAERTNEQIEQKKQQLKQLTEEIHTIAKELQEAGAWPLSDDELGDVAGGGGVGIGPMGMGGELPPRKPVGGIKIPSN